MSESVSVSGWVVELECVMYACGCQAFASICISFWLAGHAAANVIQRLGVVQALHDFKAEPPPVYIWTRTGSYVEYSQKARTCGTTAVFQNILLYIR